MVSNGQVYWMHYCAFHRVCSLRELFSICICCNCIGVTNLALRWYVYFALFNDQWFAIYLFGSPLSWAVFEVEWSWASHIGFGMRFGIFCCFSLQWNTDSQFWIHNSWQFECHPQVISELVLYWTSLHLDSSSVVIGHYHNLCIWHCRPGVLLNYEMCVLFASSLWFADLLGNVSVIGLLCVRQCGTP